MCLVTEQKKPKRIYWPMTVYKVVDLIDGRYETIHMNYCWIKGKLEERKLEYTTGLPAWQCSFANDKCINYYQYHKNVTEVSIGLHAYTKIGPAIATKYYFKYKRPNLRIVKMRIPAFSLVFTDKCDMIVSNKMKLIGEVSARKIM